MRRAHAVGVALIARMRAPAYRMALWLLRAWWVLRRPRSRGVRCILRRGDEVVLVRHSYGDRRWMLPGGRVRRSEDPIATARREMQQELGAAGTGWRVIGCLVAPRGYPRRSRSEGFPPPRPFPREGPPAPAGPT